MNTILSQDGKQVVKPIYVEAQDDGLILATVCSNRKVLLGKYKDKERAKEIIEDIFQSEHYEMPLE